MGAGSSPDWLDIWEQGVFRQRLDRIDGLLIRQPRRHDSSDGYLPALMNFGGNPGKFFTATHFPGLAAGGSRTRKNETTRFSYKRFSSSGSETKFPCASTASSRGSGALMYISRVLSPSSRSSEACKNNFGTPESAGSRLESGESCRCS